MSGVSMGATMRSMVIGDVAASSMTTRYWAYLILRATYSAVKRSGASSSTWSVWMTLLELVVVCLILYLSSRPISSFLAAMSAKWVSSLWEPAYLILFSRR